MASAVTVVALAGLLLLVGWLADRRASDDPLRSWDDLDLDPVGLLRVRYACGEMGLDEFTAAMHALQAAPTAVAT